MSYLSTKKKSFDNLTKKIPVKGKFQILNVFYSMLGWKERVM